jgi:hypothetical protein
MKIKLIVFRIFLYKFYKNLEYFFTDIDDTITNNCLLSASSFNKIWDLTNAGIKVVLITGRPAGWCDFFHVCGPLMVFRIFFRK